MYKPVQLMSAVAKKGLSDFLLFFIYTIAVLIMRYCYPMPQVSWDSNYYIEKSIYGFPGMRPVGYSKFLSGLYFLNHSISFIVWIQYLIYFLAVLALLKSLTYTIRINKQLYLIAGILILLEPVGLYNGFNILSDSLFASLTYLYIATLLIYIKSRHYLFFIAHLVFIFFCIETRHIALFYPFFSIIAMLLLSIEKFVVKALNVVLIFALFILVHKIDIKRNESAYGVPIFSSFSGWTQANNALYAVPRISMDSKFIEDPEIRELHAFFKSYLEAGTFIAYEVGSGYMWDNASPLNVLRQKVEDSLNLEGNAGENWYKSMYITAPKFNKYGLYIQKHFPYEFLMAFILPNSKTLISPHDGEMSDYYIHPTLSTIALEHYNLKNEDFYARKQIFKEFINTHNLNFYHIRLTLFVLCVAFSIFNRKKVDRIIFMIICFVGLYYALTLYSSWFMPRYLLPVLPLMSVTILFVLKNFLKI